MDVLRLASQFQQLCDDVAYLADCERNTPGIDDPVQAKPLNATAYLDRMLATIEKAMDHAVTVEPSLLASLAHQALDVCRFRHSLGQETTGGQND